MLDMIRCHLSRLLGERRISMSALAARTGLSRTTVHELYHERSTRYDADTIDKVCSALNIGVGDLLERVPDDYQRPT